MKNILIVDMQRGFIKDINKHLIDGINKYLAENDFSNIIFTKCVNNNNSPFMSILNWSGVTTAIEQEIVVNIPQNSHIMTKSGYGITNNDIAFLKGLGIKEIEICGTDIDACVLAISFNLFDNGIKPKIISSLCASSSKNTAIYKNTLDIMKRQFGDDCII